MQSSTRSAGETARWTRQSPWSATVPHRYWPSPNPRVIDSKSVIDSGPLSFLASPNYWRRWL